MDKRNTPSRIKIVSCGFEKLPKSKKQELVGVIDSTINAYRNAIAQKSNNERGNNMNDYELRQAYTRLLNENEILRQENQRIHAMIKSDMNNPVNVTDANGNLVPVTPDSVRRLLDENRRLFALVEQSISHPAYLTGPHGELMAVNTESMRTLIDEISRLETSCNKS